MQLSQLSQQDLNRIAEALNDKLNRGRLTLEEECAISELADRVVANMEADQDDE